MFNYVKCEYKKQVIQVRHSSSRVKIVNLTFSLSRNLKHNLYMYLKREYLIYILLNYYW